MQTWLRGYKHFNGCACAMCKMIVLLIAAWLGIAASWELDDQKYQVMISRKPIVEQKTYPNNTYVVENFQNRRLLCHLPVISDYKPLDTGEGLKTPNEIVNTLNGQCLELVTRDYWNFTICIGLHVTQYHKDPDGVIRGKNLFLVGNYDSDKKWTSDELLNPPIRRSNFHYQKYSNGSLCTPNLSRSAEVRFICSITKQETFVSSYYESSPCFYVFLVEVKELCSVPALYHHEREEISTITCNSIVSQEYYDSQLKSEIPTKSETSIKETGLVEVFPNEDSDTIVYDEVLNVPGNDLNQVVDIIFKKFNFFPDHIEKLPHKEKLKNVDMKTILEREGDEKPVLKWRLSYKENIDFDKLIEKADNIQESSLNMDDLNIMSIKSNNLRNLGVNNQPENNKQINKPKFVFKIIAP